MIIFIPLVLIALGLWQMLGSGDLAWSRYEYRMRSRGIVSLWRPPERDTNRKIGGVAMIVFAIIFFFVLANTQSQTRLSFSPPEGSFSVDGTPMSREQAHSLGVPVDDF